MTDTLRYVPNASLDMTLVSPTPPSGTATSLLPPSSTSVAASAARRNTVLPRVEWTGQQHNVIPFERERFEELRPLGQGGMGEVVLLKDHDIDRMVALKRLPESPDADRVLRFVEEIRTVGQLDHPNIVPVHDVGLDHLGRYYFVMKHLQGETLESIIDRLRQGDAAAHARFSFRVRLEVIMGVMNALSYAHRKGFIHRDLKPANIMVGPYGEITVVDWGLARRLDAPDSLPQSAAAAVESSPEARMALSRRTQVGMVVGTPLYMSPEQARGQHDAVDMRSDIYSLTVMLHEFLFLRHYLDGRETLAEVLEGVQTAVPPMELKTHPLQPAVPAEYTWLVEKGLAKDPAQRYASVEEMMQDLRSIMDGRIHVRCQRTIVKRGLHEALRRVDEHPKLFFFGGMATAGVVLASVLHLALSLFR